MTPPISKELMQSRPLFDPDPATFVAKSAVDNKILRRCRLSDFAVVAFAVNIQEGHLTKAEVDVFENVYVRGAKLRSMRIHEGRAALAPDGTVLSMGDEPYAGDTKMKVGPWTIASVKDCPGYKEWLADITQSERDIMKQGGSEDMVNRPLPPASELATANAYTPVKPAKTGRGKGKARGKTGPKNKSESEEEDEDEDTSGESAFPGNVSGMIDKIVDSISSFVEFVEDNAKDPGHKETLNAILNVRVREALPMIPKRKKMCGEASESAGAGGGGVGSEMEDNHFDVNHDKPDSSDVGDPPSDMADLPSDISIGTKATPKRKARGGGEPKAKKPRTARKSPAKKASASKKKKKGGAPKSNANAQMESDEEAATGEMAAEGDGNGGGEDGECAEALNEAAAAEDGSDDGDDGEYTPGGMARAKSGRKAGKN